MADTVLTSDLVVIACLAIRKEIFVKNYRFVPDLARTRVPVAVVSAGISVGAFSSAAPIKDAIDAGAMAILRGFAERCVFFSSRGLLTHEMLTQNGIRSSFCGDVAFYNKRFSKRVFPSAVNVRRIAVSDPHYASGYRDSFLYLIQRLKSLFPAAQIDLLMHGTNDEVLPLAAEAGLQVIELSKHGLDHYDTYDIHIGYRVHGHVSALSRRKPSYLIEQDDRGTDYGTTFSRRISVASHRNIAKQAQVLTSPIDTLIAIVRQDASENFARFRGLESEIEACGDRNFQGLSAALSMMATAT